MLSTARWLEMLQRAKKGGWNYTFCQILTKNWGRNTTFSSFLIAQIQGAKLNNFSRDLKKGGRNGRAYVVTFIEWAPSPGFYLPLAVHTSSGPTWSLKGKFLWQTRWQTPQPMISASATPGWRIEVQCTLNWIQLRPGDDSTQSDTTYSSYEFQQSAVSNVTKSSLKVVSDITAHIPVWRNLSSHPVSWKLRDLVTVSQSRSAFNRSRRTADGVILHK